jgi:tetratricopeptide (TPR) repeat protein
MPLSPEERIDKFSRLATQFPNSEVPHFSLAQAYRDAGRYEEAQATFGLVTDLKGEFMLAWIERARCLIALERYEEARPIAQRGYELAISQGHQEPKLDCEALLEEIEEELE